MKRIRAVLVVFLWLGLGAPVLIGAAAAGEQDGAVAAAAQAVPDVIALQFEPRSWNRAVIRVGQDFTLAADDAVRDVTVVMANATIEGRVPGDVVVVLGELRLASTAFIEGSVVVAGGGLSVEDGARVRRDLIVAIGDYHAPAAFSAGDNQIVVGPQSFGGRLDGVITWLMRGLLWGRPIVPTLPWVWTIVGLFFLLHLLLNTILDRPVTSVTATLAERPISSLTTGVAVALLFGPVAVLLAVSLVGLAVVPLVLGGMILAWMVGKVATARWIGSGLVRQTDPGERAASTRSFLIGALVVTVVYMVPLLGFLAWATTSTFALGASVLTFVAAYRRENPLPIRRMRAAVPEAAAAVPFPEAPSMTMTDSAAVPPVSGSFDEPAVPLAGVNGDLTLFPRAMFRDRLAAGVLDLILVILSWQLLDPIFRDNGVFLLMLAYLIGFWTWKGTTVGGIICQLRVVKVDGQPLRFVDALVRGLSGIFSLMVLGLGFLWILRDPERQAWHDRIAGTYVVKVPRNWAI